MNPQFFVRQAVAYMSCLQEHEIFYLQMIVQDS